MEIEGIPHRENYISYLGKNEAEISPLVDILMTQYKVGSLFMTIDSSQSVLSMVS